MTAPDPMAARPAGVAANPGLKRANEGKIAGTKRGARLGRNPKLNAHQQAEARKRVKAGLRTIAKTFGVHHATIVRLAG